MIRLVSPVSTLKREGQSSPAVLAAPVNASPSFGSLLPIALNPNLGALAERDRITFSGKNIEQSAISDTRFSGVKSTRVKSEKSQGANQPLISFEPENGTFKLRGRNMEYYMHVTADGELTNLHWGKPVDRIAYPQLVHTFFPQVTSWQHPLDYVPREFPDFNRGDNKTPAIKITTPNGQVTGHFTYKGFEILKDKPVLEGLPSLRVNPSQVGKSETLVIKLFDDETKIAIDLTYTVFKDNDVIARSAKVTNHSDAPASLEKFASLSTDLPPNDYKMLKLSGNPARERHEEIFPVQTGRFTVSSNIGASGHGQNPFIALLEPETTETRGNAYGFSLIYSGSFSAEVEQNPQQYTRMVMGLNPDTFRWKLEPGESFQAPEAIGVFSSEGLDGVTAQMHQVIKDNLLREEWKNRLRPVLLNTWEGVYFDFDHEKIVGIAQEAKKLGIELLVVDDGWFGRKYPRDKHNQDRAGLGDWVENPAVLPKGLAGLAKDVNDQGLQFGIWVEPEMVNPQSELYENHPDWVIHQPNRKRTELRNQLVLDFGRPEVQDYIIEAMSKILDHKRIRYVKWDMNRAMTEVGSAGLPPDRQMETQHRHVLGLYRVLDVLTKKYPDVLFEGCASGGGRFDPGMLAYMPQTWTSDNTDPMSRLSIQAGTGRAYPVITQGAHVSATPNHQVGRTSSLKARFHVAMSANLGLELDPTRMSEEDKRFATEQIALYKEIRPTIQKGRYRLLRNPSDNNWPAWMFTSKDKKELVVFAFQKRAEFGVTIPRVRLAGLNEKAIYQVEGMPEPLSGRFLMEIGLQPGFHGDMDSNLFRIRRIK